MELYDIYEIYRNSKFRARMIESFMEMEKRKNLSYNKMQRDVANFLDIIKINKKVNFKKVERNIFLFISFI
jgi:hypothetical protein